MKNKGAITLASVSCRDAMPDPGFYTECLNESFEVLHDAALSQATGDKKITCGFIKVTQSGNLSISGYYYDCVLSDRYRPAQQARAGFIFNRYSPAQPGWASFSRYLDSNRLWCDPRKSRPSSPHSGSTFWSTVADPPRQD